MKKLYSYTGEEFVLKEGTLEKIRENYDQKPVYLTHKKKTKLDTGPVIWYYTDERTEENSGRTWRYCSGACDDVFTLYEKIAFELGYLYDEEKLKWIHKITGYRKVKKEDVF